MAEEWRRIECYGDIGRNYEVSNLGRVRNLKGYVMKPFNEPGRYCHLVMKANGKFKGGYVHRMVCWAFHGPQPEGMEVAHENGNAHDNRVENLRWSTHQHNMDDRTRHGTCPSGAAHFATRFDAATALEIIEAKGTHAEVAGRFGTSVSTVGRLKRGETWKHLDRSQVSA